MCPENFTLNLKRTIGIIICFQDTNNVFFSYCLFSPRKKNELSYLKQTLRNTNQKQQGKKHLQNLKWLMMQITGLSLITSVSSICNISGNMEKLTLRSNVVQFHRNWKPCGMLFGSLHRICFQDSGA